MCDKTFKREVSYVLIGLLIALSLFAMLAEDPDLVSARADVVEMLAYPILLFAATAFGMDWVTKQTAWGGPPMQTRRRYNREVGKTEPTPPEGNQWYD